MIDDVLRLPTDWDAEAFYDALAKAYARASVKWWWSINDQVLRLADLDRGERVLDVACGPGELTVRAAEHVGPGGSVLGIDVSTKMLAIGRERAAERAVGNVEFVQADVNLLAPQPQEFDAVVCVLALHAVREPVDVLAWMWQLVRPGGRLVVATLGRAFFAPLLYPYLGAVGREDVDVDWLAPWRRLADPDALAAVLARAEIADVETSTDVRRIELSDGLPEWHEVVQATEIGRPLGKLNAEASARVRQDVVTWAVGRGVAELELGAVYAVARKPRPGAGGDAGVRAAGVRAAGDQVPTEGRA